MVNCFSTRVPTIQWGKGIVFNKCCKKNWISTCKSIKLYPKPTPYTKINSKWIKEPNRRVKTVKVCEENIGDNLHDIGFCNNFLALDTESTGKKGENSLIGLHKN